MLPSLVYTSWSSKNAFVRGRCVTTSYISLSLYLAFRGLTTKGIFLSKQKQHCIMRWVETSLHFNMGFNFDAVTKHGAFENSELKSKFCSTRYFTAQPAGTAVCSPFLVCNVEWRFVVWMCRWVVQLPFWPKTSEWDKRERNVRVPNFCLCTHWNSIWRGFAFSLATTCDSVDWYFFMFFLENSTVVSQ